MILNLHTISIGIFQEEINLWVGRLNTGAGADSSSPTRAQTLPAGASRDSGRSDDSKRRSFFTLGKKK